MILLPEKNIWNNIIVSSLFILDWKAWYHITVYKNYLWNNYTKNVKLNYYLNHDFITREEYLKQYNYTQIIYIRLESLISYNSVQKWSMK